MNLRKYCPQDCAEMARLFYDTVHTVNAADYTKEQLDAWANGRVDLEKWNASFLKHDTLVAVEGDTIVGFGDMDDTGYLDRLYVHKDYQKKELQPPSVTGWSGMPESALPSGRKRTKTRGRRKRSAPGLPLPPTLPLLPVPFLRRGDTW